MIDYESMILDLSTRATKLFAHDENYIVSVCIASHKDYPNFWQVWFELNKPFKGHVANPKLGDNSLVEGKSLLLALEDLDAWLYYQENQAKNIANDAEDIIESIGFGD